MLVSGSGHWADPWHPFPATSARLRELLTEHGLEVDLREDVEDALVGMGHVDLLVLNIGNNDGPSPDLPAAELGDPPTLPVLEAVAAAVQDHLHRGGALLAVHSSCTPLGAVPGWSRLLGGRWIRGRTMHPPLDACTVQVVTQDHPVTAGLEDFAVTDERYSWLHTEDDITVLAQQRHAGEQHPVVWARHDGGKVLFDALGHDERSYDSPGHRRLLHQGLDWLLT
nr:ThuA domain-containing protein [Auraticoccus cholistanensis]